MTIAFEIATSLTAKEVGWVMELSTGTVNPAGAKRLKALGILDPKAKRPLTLYGKHVIKHLKEMDKW